ncbi:MAG TPA: YbjN domain-containing protein [Mycobacteriales bacterium]|nr:YbjN domain-containing protein [Mycobacteriales bacterium]
MADDDGDYPFRFGTAAGFVRINTGSTTMVRVWAIAAMGVPRSAKLLGELNDINVRNRSAWTTWSDGLVVVEQALVAKGLRRSALKQALNAVGHTADDIGPMIATVFGGETPFAATEVAEGAA